jgi:hypothetical protein
MLILYRDASKTAGPDKGRCGNKDRAVARYSRGMRPVMNPNPFDVRAIPFAPPDLPACTAVACRDRDGRAIVFKEVRE